MQYLIDPPGGRPWALLGIAGGSIFLNLILLGTVALGGRSDDCDVETVAMAVDAQVPEAAPTVAAMAEPVEVVKTALPEGVEVVRGEVERNLSYTFGKLTSDHRDVLNAVYARLFFWDLDLARDLQKGDDVAVMYRWDGELAHIDAASYASGKLGRTLTAYRYQAAGDRFDSYWSASGEEVAYRLKASPLLHYEQVTSLVRDGRGHKGMDFKVPVGEQVVAPKAGRIVRTDWNWKYNGNCVELRYSDGVIARFLHLSETAVKEGDYVKEGQRLGSSGNTGRSTAPHLHYELESRGRVLDPVKYHGTARRKLGPADVAVFDNVRARLDAALGGVSAD